MTVKTGITYDLRDDYLAEGYSAEETLEFDRTDTIDAIEQTLQDLGYLTDRIGNIKSLIGRLASGDRWDIVFNIAEGIAGLGREAQVPAILDAYNIPYTFSDPLVLTLTLHKGMTKHVIRDLGIPTPDFAVIESEEDIEKVSLPLPLFAKPVAEGTSKGITADSKITSRKQLVHVCRSLFSTFRQPVLVETFLPGREFTIGIVGTGMDAVALGVMEVHLKENAEKDVYSFINKENCEELVEYRLVDDSMAQKAQETALAAWRGLGCRDAGRVDLRADAEGIPNFMEVNPLAGLHPEHSDLPIICNLAGITYHTLITMIMDSALKRLRGKHGYSHSARSPLIQHPSFPLSKCNSDPPR
jgi:D-alanine-D-alanine ligase